MLAWLELRAAVLMEMERHEDAATVYRFAVVSACHAAANTLHYSALDTQSGAEI